MSGLGTGGFRGRVARTFGAASTRRPLEKMLEAPRANVGDARARSRSAAELRSATRATICLPLDGLHPCATRPRPSQVRRVRGGRARGDQHGAEGVTDVVWRFFRRARNDSGARRRGRVDDPLREHGFSIVASENRETSRLDAARIARKLPSRAFERAGRTGRGVRDAASRPCALREAGGDANIPLRKNSALFSRLKSGAFFAPRVGTVRGRSSKRLYKLRRRFKRGVLVREDDHSRSQGEVTTAGRTHRGLRYFAARHLRRRKNLSRVRTSSAARSR